MSQIFDSVGAESDGSDCTAIRAQLPAFIDAELDGLDAAKLFPQVQAHLDTCEACDEEYAALLDLVMADESGLLTVENENLAEDEALLPSPALPNFVRRVVPTLIEALGLPEVVDLEQLVDQLRTPVRVLRERPLVEWGKANEGHRVVAAAYATTWAIVSSYSPREIEAGRVDQTLSEILRQQAERDAQQLGFEATQAQVFAAKYAELASKQVRTLQILAAQGRIR